MIYLAALVLTAAVSVQGRIFNNPILNDTDYTYPNAIKVNGTYYIVANTAYTPNGTFQIHSSTDLTNWSLAGYVFNDNNYPQWSLMYPLFYPQIHQIGPNYVVYFSSLNTSSTHTAVGVATAPHPLGPYTPIDPPNLSMPRDDMVYASIIKDEDNLYLMWMGFSNSIYARPLNSDGLTFSSAQTSHILVPSLSWEGSYIRSSWHIRRGDYHYLFYTGNALCSDASVGVARSTQALGPYEKLGDPILVKNSDFKCTRHTSVVKDLDDQNDVIVFNGQQRKDERRFSAVLLASVSWNTEDWPYIEEY